MATLGIVGGLEPESTIDYYRHILEEWKRDSPGSSPSIIIDSLDLEGCGWDSMERARSRWATM